MILTKRVKYSLVFLAFSCFLSFAQENVLQVPDTLQLFEKNNYKIRLNNNLNVFSPLLKMKQQIAAFNQFELYFPSVEQPALNQSVSMFQLRNEINQTMNIYRQGQNKYHLGLVSDIFGYASGAAAIGMAVYHVNKYKKYYGIK